MSTKGFEFRVAAAVLFPLAIASGCGDDTRADRDRGADTGTVQPPFDGAACPEAVIPQRFGFRWNQVNHRVSTWDVRLTGPSSTDCRPRRLETEVVGGNFSTDNSDTPTLKYAYQDRIGRGRHQLGVARQSFEVTIPPDGVVEASETFDRDELNLEHYPRVVAFLEGFRFDTDIEQSDSYPDKYNPAHGYTVHGIGASVEIEELTETTVQVAYRLRFEPGASPDRAPLNRAIEHAEIGGRLDVVFAGTSAPAQTGMVQTTASYPKPEAGSSGEFDPPPEPQRRVTLGGVAGEPPGLYGISSFNFDLTPEIDCEADSDCPEGETCESGGACSESLGDPGFYLRELTVDLRLRDYDRQTGEATFLFTGFATNSSDFVAFWPMKTEFSGRLRWIQVAGASESARSARPFRTGASSFSLLDLAH